MRSMTWNRRRPRKVNNRGSIGNDPYASLLCECVFGLPYRIFVCILGLVITTLSVTGVYIWWRKRIARAKQANCLAAQTV